VVADMPAECIFCSSTRRETIVRLEPTPLANSLAPTRALALAAPTYPLELVRCADCSLVQLGDIVPREQLFHDYKYATGAVPALVSHFRKLAAEAVSRLSLGRDSKIVEIGSNDGTVLEAFAAFGAKVLGIDPADALARHAQARGLPTLIDRFDAGVAERIIDEFGSADLLVANNVLAHVGKLDSVLRGMRRLMHANSHAVLEVAHLLPMARDGTYEFIYHEHAAYFSLHTLRMVLDRYEMEIFDAAEVPTQGGSLRCWVRVKRSKRGRAISRGMKALLDRESQSGLVDGSLLNDFAAHVLRINGNVSDVVRGLATLGRSLGGYGASARAVTFMVQCDIGSHLAWIVDDNARKIGNFVPGLGIPVVAPSELFETKPDYCVLFAWNFRDEIMKATARFAAEGGRYIVPFPTLTVH
jgi:SAM-dependent methyltransferase